MSKINKDKLTGLTGYQYSGHVFYEDTDAGSRVYHAKYLNFAERARSSWLTKLNIDQKKLLNEMSIAFVVKSLTIDYCYPLKIFDDFVVCSKLIKLTNTCLIIKQDVLKHSLNDADKNQICCKLEVEIIMMNLDRQKPIRIPLEIRSIFLENN